MKKTVSAPPRFRYYLLALSLAAGLVAWFTTYKLGAGLGTDSANYLAAAQNLADGKGLLMFNGAPLTHWAPAYSMLLAGLHLLLGVDVYVIGWVLNIVLFPISIWLSGRLFKNLVGERSLFAFAGPLFVLTSVPILSVVANISSDPLFLVIVMLFLLQSQAYLGDPSPRRLLGLGALVVAGIFTRYAGLSLAIAGALLVLLRQPGTPVRRFLSAALFGLVTLLPILAWGYFHNFALAGNLFGSHDYVLETPLQNLLLIPEKIVGWFVPQLLLSQLPSIFLSEHDFTIRGLWLAVAFVGLLIAPGTAAGWAKFTGSFNRPAVLPHLAFLFGYFLVLVFTSGYFQLRLPGFDRIHVILLPSLLCLIFLAVQTVPQRLKAVLSPRAWQLGLLAVCLGLLVFTGFRTYKYALATSQHGDVYYNFVNSAPLHQSALAVFLRQLSVPEDELVYSNTQPVAWFYLRHRIERVPRLDAPQDWPLEGHGYLVWLKGRYHYLPGLVSEFSGEDWLHLIFSDEFGDVYRFDR